MIRRTLFFLTVSLFLMAGCQAGGVDRARLSRVIERADRIVVYDTGRVEEKVIFSSTSHKDIAAFDDALVIVPRTGGVSCACIGSPSVRLYRGNTELVLIENFDAIAVHTSLWDGDAMIKDPEKWLRWFDDRNIPGPRKEFEDALAREKQGEADHARWLAAMPRSVKPHWARATRDMFSPDIKPLQDALSKDIPDPKARALALFAWFGSGGGPWSGYPWYEDIAETLLLDIPTPDLIAAAQTDNLTDAQIEGAARLFGGWDFSRKRPDDRKLLPAKLKEKLLQHSLKSSDEDKLGRARRAFSQAAGPQTGKGGAP